MHRIVIILLILLLPIYPFGATLITAGKDPEESWNDLMIYIQQNPDATDITSVGRKIAAKKRLSQFTPIREAVILEDEQLLLNTLRDADFQADSEYFEDLCILFPNIKKALNDFESKGNFDVLPIVSLLWRFDVSLKAPGEFGSFLLEKFLNDPYILDWNMVNFLQGLENASEVALSIVEEANLYRLSEDKYPSLYRILQTGSDILSQRIELEEDISDYLEVLSEIDNFDISSARLEDLQAIVSKYDNITLKKDELRTRIIALIETLRAAKVRFETPIASEDKSIQRYLNHLVKKTFSFRPFIYLIAIAVPIAVALPFPKIRLKLSLALGFKKQARKLCEKILARDPLNIELRMTLAMLYEQLGDGEKALNEYRLIKDLRKMSENSKR